MKKSYKRDNKYKKLRCEIRDINEKKLIDTLDIDGLISHYEIKDNYNNLDNKELNKYLTLLLNDSNNLLYALKYLEEYFKHYLYAIKNNEEYVFINKFNKKEVSLYEQEKYPYIYMLSFLYSFFGYNDKALYLLENIKYHPYMAQHYVELLCKENKFDKVYELLKEVNTCNSYKELSDAELLRGNYDVSLDIIENKINRKSTYVSALLQYYFVKNEPDELIKCLEKYKNNINGKIYRKYKMIYDVIFNNAYKNNTTSQMYEKYNVNDVFVHIKKHYQPNEDKYLHSIFDENFVLEEEFYKIENIINNINPVSYNATKSYFIKTDEVVGSLLGINTKNLIVNSTIDNKIVSMYPSFSHTSISKDIIREKTNKIFK